MLRRQVRDDLNQCYRNTEQYGQLLCQLYKFAYLIAVYVIWIYMSTKEPFQKTTLLSKRPTGW